MMKFSICNIQSIEKFALRPAFTNISAIHSSTKQRLHMGEYFERGSRKEIELQAPVPLAGRKYLPSSGAQGFPKNLSSPRDNFPLLVKVKNGKDASMKHWAQRSREIIDQAYQQYDKDGTAVAILFRGFPNKNEGDFSEWGKNLGFEPFPYLGGTGPRDEVVSNVTQGSTEEKEYTIEPHNELAYAPRYPKIFAMSCFKTPSWGGETAICDTRDFCSKLDPGFVQKCEEKEIRYWQCAHDKNSENNIYKSWQSQFMTEDKSIVEAYLQGKGYSINWQGNTLFYWYTQPPSIAHNRSGERLWFNQITSNHCSYFWALPRFEKLRLSNKEYPGTTEFGDGKEIDQSYIDDHRRCNWESAVGFRWQNGDILFLDQLIVQHSRLSFVGERKVGGSLFDY